MAVPLLLVLKDKLNWMKRALKDLNWLGLLVMLTKKIEQSRVQPQQVQDDIAAVGYNNDISAREV